jgi:hypothetical protein
MHFQRFNLIYLHVPKTGGNAIQSALFPYSNDRMALAGHQDGKDRFDVIGNATPHKHATLAQYAERIDVSGYRLAISVRHPFKRAVSFYFSPHRWLNKRRGKWVPSEPEWDRTKFISILDDIVPASDFLKLNGEIRTPDFIVRHENMAADFHKLTDALNLPPIKLERVNKGTAQDELLRSIEADAELRRIVEDRFRADMETFYY